MNINTPDMKALENELTFNETNEETIKIEEQKNVDDIYEFFSNEITTLQNDMPYPEINEYDAKYVDYDDMLNLQDKKKQNKPFYSKINSLKKYYCNGGLFIGHLRIDNDDYFITDRPDCGNIPLQINKNNDCYIINSELAISQKLIELWRNFNNEHNSDITFSRDIVMSNKLVNEIIFVYDPDNDVLSSSVSDSFLKKTLKENKDKPEIQNIILTISQKQLDIKTRKKDSSFIVQGCAGSGKTVILLERIKYLIINYGDNFDYVFLVHGNAFKDFIKTKISDYGIKIENIISYQDYYKNITGKKATLENTDELIFSPDYLQRVYSKEFIQDCYSDLFTMIIENLNFLNNLCEHKLTELLDNENKKIDDEITELNDNILNEINIITKDVKNYLNTKLDDISNINLLFNEISTCYKNTQTKHDELLNRKKAFEISPDDERILNNPKIIQLKKYIEDENTLLNNASPFTKTAHQNKIKELNYKYKLILNALTKKLTEDDEKAYNELKISSNYVYENISLSEAEKMLDKLSLLIDELNKKTEALNQKKTNLYNIIEKNHSQKIKILNNTILLSGTVETQYSQFVDKLLPYDDLMNKHILRFYELLDNFRFLLKDEKENFGLFNKKSVSELKKHLRTQLFKICKKKIKKEFNIKICDEYKHYWYLFSYCHYLINGVEQPKSYIFIDEAQDLSISEIELIYKLNTSISINGNILFPIMNIFGDINQTITKHGIKDWSAIAKIDTKYELMENFRNTSQVIKYCNENISTVNMIDLGIYLHDVKLYENIEILLQTFYDKSTEFIFIVKNEYAKIDLQKAIEHKEPENYVIYTVKEVKGLEFKEIFVFNRDMTNNEMYIAYTRTLDKLNIISNLQYTNAEIQIHQGDNILDDSDDV